MKELDLEGVEIEIYQPIGGLSEAQDEVSPVPLQRVLQEATSENELGFI